MPAPPDPGLCATCVNAKTIVSSKGSEFIQCTLSLVDPRFARYPTLPVVQCTGYRPRQSS